MIFKASAPSNIALIKYMGKTNTSSNIPTNGSLSYTLDYLKTNVELEVSDKSEDSWSALSGGMNLPIQLSEKGQVKFLSHLERMRKGFSKIDDNLLHKRFLVRSANEFPSDCGLASSASSFAALTLAFANCIENSYASYKQSQISEVQRIQELAQLSRQGSGSSCRSFFSPWGFWKNEEVGAIDLPYKDLLHFVVVVDQEKKSVSSSEAHKRVTSSDLFFGRPERANKRLDQLIGALKNQNWQQAFEITWIEFMDMHALFETSVPPFRYRNSGSFKVLDLFESQWNQLNDGPIVTMDAGPNVHALYRLDQKELALDHLRMLEKQFLVVADPRLTKDKSDR